MQKAGVCSGALVTACAGGAFEMANIATRAATNGATRGDGCTLIGVE